jgi:ribosomal protein S27AE
MKKMNLVIKNISFIFFSTLGGVGRMWKLNKCPRCGGDVFIDEDIDRCYEKCLQCGYERELERVPIKRRQTGESQESRI